MAKLRYERLKDSLMMITDFLMSLFGQTVEPIEREANNITPLDKPKSDKKKAIPDDKFKDDIEALKVFYSLEEGTVINISLQDLLAIIPRNRPRIEAYQGLRSWLFEKYRVTLNINSRKTKAYE
jgi:hypothetical protein